MQERQQTQQKTTSTDSLFGMALCQAFTGLAFGTGIEQMWEAAEVTSQVYTDRFKLGQQKSLTGTFERKSVAETERQTFRPSFKPAMSFGLVLAA